MNVSEPSTSTNQVSAFSTPSTGLTLTNLNPNSSTSTPHSSGSVTSAYSISLPRSASSVILDADLRDVQFVSQLSKKRACKRSKEGRSSSSTKPSETHPAESVVARSSQQETSRQSRGDIPDEIPDFLFEVFDSLASRYRAT